jgi:hypothetical protein
LFFCFFRFILDKKIGVGQPKRIENAKILVANTAMDTDKVKIYGARVRVDSMSRVAEIEAAEKGKMIGLGHCSAMVFCHGPTPQYQSRLTTSCPLGSAIASKPNS